MASPLWETVLSWGLTIIGLVGNCFVLLLIVFNKRLFKQFTNWFLFSLSFADLAVIVSLYPVDYLCSFSKVICNKVWYGSFRWAFLYASVFNICTLTLDRYLAIVKPFMYIRFMTKTCAMVLISVAWIFPFASCFAIFTFLGRKDHVIVMHYYSYYMVITFEFLPTLILVLATLHMISIAKKHAHETASVFHQLQHNHPGAQNGNTASKLRKKRRRSAGLMFIVSVVLFFVLCYSWQLFATFCFIFKVCKVPSPLIPLKKIFLIGNSVFNPFAYGFLKHDIKEEVKRLLRFGAKEGQRWSMEMGPR